MIASSILAKLNLTNKESNIYVSVGRLSQGVLPKTLRDANPPYYDFSLIANAH